MTTSPRPFPRPLPPHPPPTLTPRFVVVVTTNPSSIPLTATPHPRPRRLSGAAGRASSSSSTFPGAASLRWDARFRTTAPYHAHAQAHAAPRCASNPATSTSEEDDSAASGMEGSIGSALFPLHRCKILHLVRHAQGIHNVEGEKDYKAYMSPDLFDAHLTQLGWQQADNLRKHVHSSGLIKKIDLVVTSPLLRTMQTAVGVFGGEGYSDGISVLPLMVANAGNSNRSAISSLNCPPFLAVELCREHLGVHPCDRRRSTSEYQQLFPAIDFSLIEDDEDVQWVADVREPNEDVAARGMKFLDWLWTRKEKEIAVVTHSGFLYHTLKKYGNDCHPLVKDEISKHFANCELRSMVLVDRSMLGSDPSPTNYPGKIPRGPDLSSEAADVVKIPNGLKQ